MTIKNLKNIELLTEKLLTEIGEDPNREGLIKTPHRVSKSWKYLTGGYNQTIEDVANGAIFSVENKKIALKHLTALL